MEKHEDTNQNFISHARVINAVINTKHIIKRKREFKFVAVGFYKIYRYCMYCVNHNTFFTLVPKP